MKITQEQTNKILKTLEDYGFKVLIFGTSFENPFESISDGYFNEKVNEALGE